MPVKSERLINLVPLMFVFLWSTGFIGAKYALPFIEPFYLLFIRMVITIAVFLGLAYVMKVSWPSPKQACHQMVAGILIHGSYLGGVFTAIKLGMPAGVTAIVVGIQPLLTAILSWQWFGDRLIIRQWLGLGLGLVGVCAVLLSTKNVGDFSLEFDSMTAAIVALITISVGTLYQKRFGAGVDLLAGSLWQYVSTAIMMGLFAFAFESREVIWHPQLILALAWLVFGLSVSAILLLMYMIREGESAKVASYFYLVPPVAAIEAWILFDESLPVIAVLAIAVTVLGVYLVNKRS